MGCAPSSDHRHLGLRHEPFHNSVFPVSSGGSDVWATPVFQQDFRNPVDLSAFLSPAAPIHSVPSEDPPPYSEQLLEGHITLMLGGKQETLKDDSSIPEERDPNDSTMLIARDLSILNSSTQGTSFSLEGDYHTHSAMDEISRHVHDDTGVEYADAIQSDNIYAVRSSTPTRPTTLRGNDPFSGSPSMATTAPPLFQRPYHSFSLDSSNVPIFTNSIHRNHPTANAGGPFLLPPRLLPINSVHAMHSLREDPARNPPFPARPARLPPLQGNSGDMASQHRKRNKRRRGHSWHGEARNVTTGTHAISPTIT